MMIEVMRLKFFIDKLIAEIEKKNSVVCVGLDPHLDRLPDFLLEKYQVNSAPDRSEKTARLRDVIIEFNSEIIAAVAKTAVIVKPQLALYEQLGLAGIEALKQTIDIAQKEGLLVLLDGKRNDIGSSARGYADAYLKTDSLSGLGKADALTINPFLGQEGIAPFLNYPDKGAFALVRTSNPGAGALQDLLLADDTPFYLKLGSLIAEWGSEYQGESGYSNLGAVVGATRPEELAHLRAQLESTFFLIPGYGAQGGGAAETAGGFDERGLGGIVNAARSIIFAWQRPEIAEKFSTANYAEAAEFAARQMKEEINEVRVGGKK